jgi:hypothetical protein
MRRKRASDINLCNKFGVIVSPILRIEGRCASMVSDTRAEATPRVYWNPDTVPGVTAKQHLALECFLLYLVFKLLLMWLNVLQPKIAVAKIRLVSLPRCPQEEKTNLTNARGSLNVREPHDCGGFLCKVSRMRLISDAAFAGRGADAPSHRRDPACIPDSLRRRGRVLSDRNGHL